MSREEFEKIVEEEFPRAVPAKFHHLIKNVGFLIEDEPDEATRKENNLRDDQTLLGLYKGVALVNRGESYGIGDTLPDTITLYQRPTEDEAAELLRSDLRSGLPKVRPLTPEEAVRRVVRETIWHEVAHYLGYDEDQVRDREEHDKI